MNIKIINVTKIYGNRKVLDNVSFDVNTGNFIAFTGDSGAGKTTLMSIMNTLMRPTQGSVYYNGKNFAKLLGFSKNAIRRDQISLILQEPAYFRNLNVKDNILLPYYFGFADIKTRKDVYEEYVEAFGLKSKEKFLPGDLSGGEIRKMILLRSVLKPMEILFADEPTADLDANSTTAVIRLFAHLNKRGRTIVLATHNPVLAKSAKDVYEIGDGKIRKMR